MDDPVLTAILEGLDEGWTLQARPREWFEQTMTSYGKDLHPDSEPIAYDQECGVMYVTLDTFTRVKEYCENDGLEETHGDS